LSVNFDTVIKALNNGFCPVLVPPVEHWEKSIFTGVTTAIAQEDITHRQFVNLSP